MSGARNLHRLVGALERLRKEATEGKCTLCSDQSIGYVESWDAHPRGICERHAGQAVVLGYRVHRPTEEENR